VYIIDLVPQNIDEILDLCKSQFCLSTGACTYVYVGCIAETTNQFGGSGLSQLIFEKEKLKKYSTAFNLDFLKTAVTGSCFTPKQWNV